MAAHRKQEIADRIAGEMAHFDQKIDEWKAVAATVGAEVEARLADAGLKHFTVSSRAKSRERFEKKVRKDPFRRVEDMIGVRVSCCYASDIPVVQLALADYWIVEGDSWVDKQETVAAAEFGYRSVQFICRLRVDDLPLGGIVPQENLPHIGQKVEVQLRTALANVWAELEHQRYEHREQRSREADRLWGLTSALLEQADANLDRIRSLPGGLADVRDEQPVGHDLERFVQYHQASRALDTEIAKALDIEQGSDGDGKDLRELRYLITDIQGQSWVKLEKTLADFGDLGRRLAISVAPTDRSIILADWQRRPCIAFRGIGLFFAALAQGLTEDLVPLTSNEFGDRPHRAIPDHRYAEYKVVLDYLTAHPGLSALDVRAMYLTKAQAFTPVIEERSWAPVIF
jgi:ppGpp synthetase/RelA/SpoT-type nucleotidyltranferase